MKAAPDLVAPTPPCGTAKRTAQEAVKRLGGFKTVVDLSPNEKGENPRRGVLL